MNRRVSPLRWEVGFHPTRDESPRQWVPARVPGAVQLDWAAAHGWPPYWYADHWRDYVWTEDVYWTYRAVLPSVTDPQPGERLVFVCDGVDYRFHVARDGETLHEQEGMFTPSAVDLGPAEVAVGDSVLTVTIHPVPKSRPAPADRAQADHSCKPAVSYGWDFHPRLIPSGIWQDAWLEVRPACGLARAELRYRLAEDFSRAELDLGLETFSRDLPSSLVVRWRLRDPAGKLVVEQTCREVGAATTLKETLAAPLLWWPHDQGTPHLYRVEVETLDARGGIVEARAFHVGFRRVRLVMHEGAWQWPPDRFPKGRSHPPVTVEINGRHVFAKGANWVSPDIFPGTLDRARYHEQIGHARDANMNILRVWGGAPAPAESFYELCDELGLLVWQEFPLACNHYPDDDPHYLAVLDQESRSLLRRLRAHPCVALWCGGNELFNSWSGMTDQSLPLRLLNRNCYELDPGTPFIPTAPVMGMGHGHYTADDPARGGEAWGMFQGAECTAYSEFGCSSPAPVETLRSFLPAGDLFPPRPGTAWETHHAYGVWLPESHLYPGMIERYLGPSGSLEELVEKGQTIQAVCYQGLFEEVRRQKPRASMALCWCLNEPWPAAANNSLLSWPCVPKPALRMVAAACRPVLASARVPKMLWEWGELFTAELWMLSDAPAPVPAGRVEASLHGGRDEALRLLSWDFAALPANTNGLGPRVQVRLPAWSGNRFELRLRVADHPALDSSYTLFLRRPPPPPAEAGEGTKTMNL